MKDWAAVIAATIAAIASILTLFLNTKLAFGRERRQALWNKELERFSELEEQAGNLVEEILTYSFRGDDRKQEFYNRLLAFHKLVGRFRRYPDVAQAIRKLHNVSGWFVETDMKHDSKEEYEKSRIEIDETYKELITACDVATNRPKI